MPTRSSRGSPVKKKKSGGFSPKTFKGMSKKRMASKGGNFGRRVPMKENVTTPIQAIETPEDATEFEVHAFQEEGRWWFVPCAGDACPLCQSESEQVRRTSYRFLFNVYNLEAKKVQLLEGGNQLAAQVFRRFERRPSSFTKRTFEVTRLPTKPISFLFELGEEPVVRTANMELIDHDEYLVAEMKAYYGDDLPEAGPTSLDEDDDYDDDEDDDEEYEPPRRKKKSTSSSRTSSSRSSSSTKRRRR